MHARWRLAGAALAAAPWVASTLAAQPAAPLPRTLDARPTGASISASDLMSRLYAFADDSMGGRASGSEGQRKATAYLAAEAERMGLRPAGDGGTWFQDVPLLLRGVVAGGVVRAGGKRFVLGEDFGATVARDGIVQLPAEAPVVFGGEFGDTTSYLDAAEAAGRIVVLRSNPRVFQLTPRGLAVLAGSRYAGAVAVVVALWDQYPAPLRRALSQPSLVMRTERGRHLPPTLIASAAMAEAMLGRPLAKREAAPEASAALDLVFFESPAPARNVIAMLPGSDPALRGQFVVIGAHSDHDPLAPRAVDHDSARAMAFLRHRLQATLAPGTRPSPAQLSALRVNVDSLRALAPARPDSIRNGADDDGSGSVAVLEIAEAMAASDTRPRRSVLFVWHAAEELGLLGSAWFAEHPPVPHDSIVAMFNLDMVGRGGAGDIAGGGPDYVQLIGARRLSSALGDLVEKVNAKQAAPLRFDHAFDADGHRENLYCRSDHANYARHGIPVAFFTTGLHPDYHQVTDEPQYIDYGKLARIAGLVHDVARAAADRRTRFKLDRGRPDPQAPCRQ